MGQWQIRGADRASGHDVGQIYDADTRETATTMAVRDGMLVETVELLVDDTATPADPLDELNAALRREASMRAEPAAALLDYGNAAHHRSRGDGPVPSYGGLLLAGRIIRVFAFVYYTLGVLVIAFAVINFTMSTFARPFMFESVLSLTWACGVAMIGALLHGLGSACFALRDIARNSWR